MAFLLPLDKGPSPSYIDTSQILLGFGAKGVTPIGGYTDTAHGAMGPYPF